MKLRDHAKSIGLEVGCSDSGCIWGAQSGMCTNGGCRCISDVSRTWSTKQNAVAMTRVAQHLAAEVELLRASLCAEDEDEPLRVKIARMRPVVDAAIAWANGNDPARPEDAPLLDAVTTYEMRGNRG